MAIFCRDGVSGIITEMVGPFDKHSHEAMKYGSNLVVGLSEAGFYGVS